jgi:hypothetical protein
MLEEFLKKMDTHLVYLGIDEAVSKDFYKEKMSHLSEAIENFHSSAIVLQNIAHVDFSCFLLPSMNFFHSGCEQWRTIDNRTTSRDAEQSYHVH